MKAGTRTSESRALRIVAADDSAVMRRILRLVFELHAADAAGALPRMELAAVVADGVEALRAVERLRPDVLLLDLEMPGMGGLAVLDRLRASSPTLPVIMCSAHTMRGAQITLDALRRGANDYVMKPNQQVDFAGALKVLTAQLLPRIAALAAANSAYRDVPVAEEPAAAMPPARPAAAHAGGPIEETAAVSRGDSSAPVEVVVVGVSTGGPSALELLLPMLPADLPVPVLIVQHMPKVFTSVLAERLDKLCGLRVREARDGERVLPGAILLAPGDAHLETSAVPYSAGAAQVRLHQGPALNSCRPSVDYLFHSAARLYGAGTLALVLTGMGSDGLEGARAVTRAGGTVLAQDEASSAVWGMPGRVAREGLASATLPLRALAATIVQRVAQGRASTSPASPTSTYRREVHYGLL